MISRARLVVLQAVARVTSSQRQTFYRTVNVDSSLSSSTSSIGLHCGNHHRNHRGNNRNDPTLTNTFGVSNTTTTISMASAPQDEEYQQMPPPSLSNKPSLRNLSHKRERERSVTWDSSVSDLKSVFKKPKRTNSLRRSTKSFGKPNSETFESAKNSTFAEFGHLTNNPNVPKIGSGGRLIVPNAHHLSAMHKSAMQLSARHSLSRNNFGLDANSGKNGNESFGGGGAGMQQPQSSLSSMQMAALLSSSSSSSQHVPRKPTFTELARNAKYSQVPPRAMNSMLSFQNLLAPHGSSKKDAMKRTPTQLECMMLKKTQNNKSAGGNAMW